MLMRAKASQAKVRLIRIDQGCSTGGPGAGCGPPLQFLRPSRNFASLEFFILNFLPKQTDRLVTILTAML